MERKNKDNIHPQEEEDYEEEIDYEEVDDLPVNNSSKESLLDRNKKWSKTSP